MQVCVLTRNMLLNRDLQGAGEAAVTPFVRISRVSADGKEAVVGTGEMR